MVLVPVDLASMFACARCGQTLRPAAMNSARRFYERNYPSTLSDANGLGKQNLAAK